MAGAAATLSTRMKRAVTGLVGEGDVSAHHVEDERGLRDLLSHHEESPEPNLHIVVKDRRMFFKASRRTKDSPGLRITADGLNLSKADLSGRDLEGASLRGTDLSLANLVGTNLQ